MYNGDMELSREMDNKDYYKFLRLQRDVFHVLQDRGYYLKGINMEDLHDREKERCVQFVYKIWNDVLEFEKS